jgi:serine protease AprX
MKVLPMKNQLKTVMILSLIFSSSSYAGTVLRLKSGIVSTQPTTLAPPTRSPDTDKVFVAQFKDPITASDERSLIEHRLSIIRYLPDDALIVYGKTRDLSDAQLANPAIRTVVNYHPEWKISRTFFEGSRLDRNQLMLITLINAELTHEIATTLEQMPRVKVVSAGNRFVYVQANSSLLLSISQIEGIEWIEPAPLFQTMDFFADSPTPAPSAAPIPPAYTGFENGTKIMNFAAAWSRGYHGEGQLVGIDDTGLDLGKADDLHPDFVGNLYKAYALGLGSDSWEDSMGHGTHTSGLIVGTGKLSDGRIRGGAYAAHLLMGSLWSPLVDGLVPGTDFDAILGPSYNDGARIHSNSWGSESNFGEYDSFAANLDQFTWDHPDMLVLFAAGNNGVDDDHNGVIDLNSIGSPATAKNVLTVGASENYFLEGGIQKPLSQLRDGDKHWSVEPLKSDTLSNHANGIACFSSRGPTKDGRIKPDVVAPGTNIVSTRSRFPNASHLWGDYDSTYIYAGGTSMATPLAAGAAAVTRQFLVQTRGLADPSAAVVKAVLMHTALDLFPGQYGTGPTQEIPAHRPNVQEGYGRVDVDFSTRLANETQIIDEQDGIGLDEKKSVALTVRPGATLRATLAYTDAPAAETAATALVNDLALKVVTPDGQVIMKDDHINNTAMIELPNAVAGTYQIQVIGTNVPQGKDSKQPYGLVVGAY